MSICLLLIALLQPSNAAVRLPAVAGTFYPANPGELRSLVESHLAAVTESPQIEGQLLALIVPHAGLIYSGQIAANSYKLLAGSGIEKVILCGPAHRYGFEGISIYGPEVTWRTPLGDIACNDELCQAMLTSDKMIKVIPQAHTQEHCLEVQLPYLQTVLPDFEIVPAILGYQNPESIDALTKALTSLPLDEQTVMIASSDWQHYRPAAEGWPLDSLGIACVRDLDPDRLESDLLAKQVEACGGGVVVAVLKAALAHGANHVEILKYGDSGDITGDRSSVVGYLAAAIYRVNESEAEAIESASEPYQLTDSEKQELLTIARETIRVYLAEGSLPDFSPSPKLREPGAAFVTLEKNDRLRGCIGYTQALMPLYETVANCAVSAAIRDSRFSPVKAGELDSLHIEISVLTPLEVVKSFDEIEVGRDGLMITKGSFRGLLLPQVATDYGWDRQTFLEQTCVKAGLRRDAYRS
ncbi:MAG: AmmeMemoRadiSam system protein B, partial [bacterium]